MKRTIRYLLDNHWDWLLILSVGALVLLGSHGCEVGFQWLSR